MLRGFLVDCYGTIHFNIFKNINNKIPFQPIGKNCTCKYCINSSHFLSQGCIPSLLPLPSYGQLRNREKANWYTLEMKNFLYSQFEDVNPKISFFEQIKFIMISLFGFISYFTKSLSTFIFEFFFIKYFTIHKWLSEKIYNYVNINEQLLRWLSQTMHSWFLTQKIRRPLIWKISSIFKTNKHRCLYSALETFYFLQFKKTHYSFATGR